MRIGAAADRVVEQFYGERCMLPLALIPWLAGSTGVLGAATAAYLFKKDDRTKPAVMPGAAPVEVTRWGRFDDFSVLLATAVFLIDGKISDEEGRYLDDLRRRTLHRRPAHWHGGRRHRRCRIGQDCPRSYSKGVPARCPTGGRRPGPAAPLVSLGLRLPLFGLGSLSSQHFQHLGVGLGQGLH